MSNLLIPRKLGQLIATSTILFFAAPMFAQFQGSGDLAFKQHYARATAYLYESKFALAMQELKTMDSLKPNNANIMFQIGFCYLQPPRNPRKAIHYLERACSNLTPLYREGHYKEDKAPVFAVKYLADAYHTNYEFDAAIATYERFIAMLPKDDIETKKMAEKQIATCKHAMALKQNPVNMTVTNLGGVINSKYADYAAIVNADESFMIFTSRRAGSTGDKLTEDGTYYEDIYYTVRDHGDWASPQQIGSTINTIDHEATVSLTADGQTMVIYKYDEVGQGDLYASKLVGERWTVPMSLGIYVNTNHKEAHASISADGQYLFFSSDRPGGFGGLDLYYAKRLPNGEWSMVQNLGNGVNTAADEDFPFIHPDGVSLFFSSTGHNSMGGYDIYFTEKLNDKDWLRPNNMGYPVNTPNDDIFFVPTTDGKRAYYSSFRSDGFGDQDIYMVTFPEFKEKPLTVYKGSVKGQDGKVPEDVSITVTDNATGEVVGIYTPNAATGKYIIILTPGRNYNISYESSGFLFHSENMDVPMESNYFEIQKHVDLQVLTAGNKMELKNIFFDFGSADLQNTSFVELEKVYKMLKGNAALRVEISGHSDSKGDDAANLKVSQQRAQAVVDYLVKQGIESSKLIAKGYGEAMPIAPNENADGSDNEEGRARNRRIEMKVLEK